MYKIQYKSNTHGQLLVTGILKSTLRYLSKPFWYSLGYRHRSLRTASLMHDVTTPRSHSGRNRGNMNDVTSFNAFDAFFIKGNMHIHKIITMNLNKHLYYFNRIYSKKKKHEERARLLVGI
jgi:hypothetical protein